MIRKAPLADWLREARENAGMSQGQVARQLGYSSPQFISNWERGLASPPIPKFKKLCKMYNLSVQDAYDRLLQATLTEVERKLNADFFSKSKVKTKSKRH